MADALEMAPSNPVADNSFGAETSSIADTAKPKPDRQLASAPTPAAPATPAPAADPNLVDEAPAAPADPNLVPDPQAGPASDPNLVPDTPPEPDMSAIKKMAAYNFKNPETANSFWGALKAGFEKSSASLAFQAPTIVLPEHADMFYRIASGAATAAGDIPAYVAGGIGGTIAGAELGPGAAVTGLAGAGALPAAIRKWKMDQYEKGTIQSPGDAMGRIGGTIVDAAKGALVNVATMGLGKMVGPVVGEMAGPLVGTAAKSAAEVATMTTTASALEGKMPSAQDFVDNAFVVGALHGISAPVTKIAGTLRNVYAETGVHPAEVATMAEENPILKQKLQSVQNPETPAEVKAAAPPEEVSENDKALAAENPKPKIVSGAEAKPHPDMADGTTVSELKVPQMPEEKEIYHGSNTKFDTYDFNRGGGMVHFAENPEDAAKYSLDTGSGGRTALGFNQIVAQADSGERFTYDAEKKQWVNEADKEHIISHEDMKNYIDDGDFSFHPKDANIRSEKIDMSKVVDTTTPEGLQKLKSILKPTNPRAVRLIRAINDELAGTPGAMHFGDEFWSLTKHARGDEINANLQKITQQMKDAGLHGIKFWDDTHKTIAAFDNAFGGGKPPVEPPIPGSLEAANAYIDSKIKTAPEDQGTPFSADKLYQRVLDQTHGLGMLAKELAGGKELTALNNPQTLARLTAGTNSAFNHAVKYGPFDPHTREILPDVKPYTEIFKDVDMNRFQRYMVAKRVGELNDRGIKAFGKDTDVEAASKVAAVGEAEFGQTAKDYGAWKNSFIDYGQKLGLFSEGQAKSIKDMNANHISFNRLFEEDQARGPGGKNLKVVNPIKAIGGSERDLVDPLKNDLLHAYKIMQAADRNNVINTLAGLAEANPEAAAQPNSLFQKAPTPMQKFTVTGDEINKYFLDRGVSPDATSADFWRASHKDLGPNQVQSFVDGKRTVFDTTPEAAEAIKGITDTSQANLLNKFINGPGRALRAMQMVNPIFWERHFVRSQENAMATSTDSPSPIRHMFDAIGGMLKKSDDYQEFLRSGGANESWSSIHDYIDKKIPDLEQKTGIFGSMVNGVQDAHSAMLLGFHKMEESLHFAKYLAVRGEDADPESRASAAFAARSVNGDIAMRGSSSAVKWYSAATPFWSQHMAGLAETAKTFAKDPVAATAQMAKIYTIPALVNWWLNKDDERYQNLPTWQKVMALPIMTDKWEDAPIGSERPVKDTAYSRIGPNGQVQMNNGSIWKIPMFETGMLFASMPVMALDALYRKNPGSLDGLGEALFQNALPMDIPAVLHPVLEQFANRSTLTGNPLIPSGMEGRNDIAPQFKYTDYTSETAKQIGKVIHQIPIVGNTSTASPIVVENYIRSWTGSLGMYALKLADMGLEKLPQSAKDAIGVENQVAKPDGTWADNPFTTAFAIRNPTMSAKGIQDFFSRYDAYLQTKNTIAQLEKRGDMTNLDKFMQRPETQANLIPLDKPHEAIMKMNTFTHMILKDPGMTPHDKRQLTDWTMIQMIQTATGMVEQRDEMAKGLQNAPGVSE